MNPFITPEAQRALIAQWRDATVELEDFRRQELQSMTDEQARAASELLLGAIEFPRPPSWRDETSGLVEQQRIFQRAQSPR